MVISDIFYCYCCFLFKYSFVLFVVIFIVYFVLSLHYLCCSYPIGGAWQSEATLPQPRGHAAFRADIACPPPPTQAFDLIKQLQNAPQADGTRGPVPPEPGCGRTAGLRRGVRGGGRWPGFGEMRGQHHWCGVVAAHVVGHWPLALCSLRLPNIHSGQKNHFGLSGRVGGDWRAS